MQHLVLRDTMRDVDAHCASVEGLMNWRALMSALHCSSTAGNQRIHSRYNRFCPARCVGNLYPYYSEQGIGKAIP